MKRLLFALVVLASCQTVRPTELSIDQHEAVAAEEREKARAAIKRYDPDATTTTISQAALGWPDFETYNPTDRFLSSAARHRRLAAKHEKAAVALATSEDQACRPLAVDVRAACPVLGSIARVEKIANGAKVQLANTGQTDAVAARIQCHVAFGDAQGDAAVLGCPLYIRGLGVSVKDGFVVFKVRHAEDEDRLMQLLNEHLVAANAAE
jgi:hypothetical protein